jgi:histidinol-phosphatase (PHP family)
MPSEKKQLKPLPLAGVADYHCHCDYSVDAKGPIAEYCEAALQRGLAEICFTSHYDTSPASRSSDCFIRVNGENKPANPDNLRPYVDDVLQAHEKFYPLGLSVKLGIEIGWWEGCAESVAQLKERYSFDHVLCGIHEIDSLCICSKRFGEYFENYRVEELLEKYYRQTIEASRSGLFDAIAHLGYYVRFGHAYYGKAIYSAHETYLNGLFDALKESDTALEINTSAIRHGFHEYYPHMAIINAAKKAGVAVQFLGSDAHKPEQIGLDFEAAVALVPDAIVTCDD